jgi:hypothetical protein
MDQYMESESAREEVKNKLRRTLVRLFGKT